MAKSKFPCGHEGGKPIDNKDVIILGSDNAYCTVDKKEFEWMPAHWREKVPRTEKDDLKQNPVVTVPEEHKEFEKQPSGRMKIFGR